MCVFGKRGHQAIPQASERLGAPEEPTRQLGSARASCSHLSEHDFGIKGQSRRGMGPAPVRTPRVGLNCEKELLPSLPYRSFISAAEVCSSPARPSGANPMSTNHSPCAWCGWV